MQLTNYRDVGTWSVRVLLVARLEFICCKINNKGSYFPSAIVINATATVEAPQRECPGLAYLWLQCGTYLRSVTACGHVLGHWHEETCWKHDYEPSLLHARHPRTEK